MNILVMRAPFPSPWGEWDSKIMNHEALTNLETSYIKAFDFSTLYNFKKDATSSLGYQHTEEAKAKMVEYYKDKTNHPMYGKTPTPPHPPPCGEGEMVVKKY